MDDEERRNAGVTTSLAFGAAFFLAILVTYDILRYFFPGFFFYREAAAKDPQNQTYAGSPLFVLPRPSPWPLSWIPFTLSYPEHKLIRTHGFDVTMFLRFLLTQVKLFAVLTVFTAVVLYPTYITASNRDLPLDSPNHVSGIQIASLANVPDKSHRLWVTLASEVVVVSVILFFLYRDIVKYTYYRRLYRAQSENPSNYAALVVDIPPQSRTREIVAHTFERVFPGQVVAVHIVRNAENLLNLKNRYVTAVSKRERAEWVIAADASASDSPSHPATRSERRRASRDERRASRRERRAARHRSGSDGDSHVDESHVAACQAKQDALRVEIAEKEADLDAIAPVTSAAVVVFRTKRAATFAVTAPFWLSEQWWRVSRAAEPRAMNWDRLDISGYTKLIRQYATLGILTTLTFLWTFPSTFIQGLGNFDQFVKQWPDSFLADFKESHPGFTEFLEGVLPPLLLFLLLLVVPLIVRFILSFERIHSRTLVEAKIRNFLFFFYTMSNFIYVVVLGSVFNKVADFLDNPTSIVSLLSTTVPRQATFLMKYVLFNAFLGSAMGMLNIGRLLVRPFTMLGKKTEREKRNADKIFAQYPFAKIYALCAMISLISYVYSTIAPVICAVALLYFSIAYLCTKQILLYSHRPLFEGGGFLFRDAWTGLLIGLFVHQLSMIGIFSLKRAAPQAVLAIVSLIFSLWFTLYCRRVFLLRSKHGSLVDQANADDELGEPDEIPDGFADMYEHPGLRPVEEIAEFRVKEVSGDQKHAQVSP